MTKTDETPATAAVYDVQYGRYQHFKGNYYELIGVAKHSETGEQLVVYKACYGMGQLFVRPISMFFENVDGRPRFRFVG